MEEYGDGACLAEEWVYGAGDEAGGIFVIKGWRPVLEVVKVLASSLALVMLLLLLLRYISVAFGGGGTERDGLRL